MPSMIQENLHIHNNIALHTYLATRGKLQIGQKGLNFRKPEFEEVREEKKGVRKRVREQNKSHTTLFMCRSVYHIKLYHFI